MMKRHNMRLLIVFSTIVTMESSSLTTTGYCGEGRCCANLKMVEGKCIPCSPGTYGVNCTEPCPDGFYGIRCMRKCECSPYQNCLPNVGCTLPEHDIQNGDALAGSLSIIVIVIIALLVVYIGKRYNIWNHRICRRICKVPGDPASDIESNNRLSQINAVSNPIQPDEYSYSYSSMNVYEGLETENSGEYDQVELRLRTVSCVSFDMDALEKKSEYVLLERENSEKKTVDHEGSVKKDDYEAPLKMYELASNTTEPTKLNDLNNVDDNDDIYQKLS